MTGLAAGAASIVWFALRSAEDESPTVPSLPSPESSVDARREPPRSDPGLAFDTHPPQSVSTDDDRPSVEEGGRLPR